MKMGFEGSKMPGFISTSKHKRSKSYPEKRRDEVDEFQGPLEGSYNLKLDSGDMNDSVKSNKKCPPASKVHSSLKHEILQLEKRLQDQFEVRRVLESALGLRSFTNEDTAENLIPKPATQLIKEISVLELEVIHLEQYLLTLYRQAFDQQATSLSPSTKNETLKSRLLTTKGTRSASQTDNFAVYTKKLDNPLRESNDERDVHRCHSTLSQRSVFSARTSPPAESFGRGLRVCQSQPLSMMEYNQNSSSDVISLAEHLGTRISDHVLETPNKISEDMIKCMSAIYCKLTDTSLANQGLSSPISSLSSTDAYSPRHQCGLWSPGTKKDTSFDVRLDNPFLVRGLKEFSGPYSAMIEVPWLHRDAKKMANMDHLLEDYRSLIVRLEEVDPRKLKQEEKLAFWINIHNALVMHAFLAYGIPPNNMKRVLLLLKAAYNVGGHTISANTIQSSILGCKMFRPGQWLRLILSSKSKFKTGDDRQAYALEHPEPLLNFALCSGSHSDPAVRLYTPKRVLQDLEVAKEDYIRATFGFSRKEKKVNLPKIVEAFAKESGLCPVGIIEMIQETLPEHLRKSVKKTSTWENSKEHQMGSSQFHFSLLNIERASQVINLYRALEVTCSPGFFFCFPCMYKDW